MHRTAESCRTGRGRSGACVSVNDIEAMFAGARPVKADDGQRPFAPPEAYKEKSNGKGNGAARNPEHNEPLVKPIVFRTLADIVAEKRETRWLIADVLEREVLAILAGPRSTFKSFIGLDWMMRIALAGESVVILSGEGAGLDRRADAWMRTFAPSIDLASLPIVALERAVNLNVQATLEVLGDACEALPARPVAVMIDTVSKFTPGMKENDNAEVSAFLAAVSEAIRDRLRCTPLGIAHTGHAEQGRPRGAYVFMANTDAEYIVDRPDLQAMTVTVTRERFKDTAALPPLAYCARVVDLGRLDARGQSVTSLVLDSTDAPANVGNTRELRGKAQRQIVTALRARSQAEPERIWTLVDLRALGRDLGLTKGTVRSAVDAIATSPYMQMVASGYRFTDGGLGVEKG